jgi:hypothetical protein
MENKFSKKIIVIVVTLLLMFNNTPVLADSTHYWYKGANFNEYITMSGQKQRMTDSQGNPLSAVVVTASTEYVGNSNGQEMIRAFSRNTIVKNYYKADAVRATQIDLKFTSATNKIGFIQTMSPNDSSVYTGVGPISFLLQGYYASAYNIALALSNNLTAGVKQYRDSNNSIGEIVIYNSSLSNVELPSTIGYKDAHQTYDGIIDSRTGQKIKNETSRGVVGYFNFYYALSAGQSAYLDASARAWYDIGITVNGWPKTYSSYTDYATVRHSISGK